MRHGACGNMGHMSLSVGDAAPEFSLPDQDKQVVSLADLRDAIIEVSGGEMVDEDTDEVADVVILWWREDDGDLFDALTDAITSLADEGVVWLLVPKSGRPGHVEPGDVTEVAPTAGLQQTSSISAAKDWSGIRLVTPKAARTRR